LAVWFHDVIYDSRSNENEERSAAYAGEVLQSLHLAPSLQTETQRLILLTKSHLTSSEDIPGRVLLDADLAILGAAEPSYDRYAEAIRREYDWVPQADYRVGRQRVLQRFLDRPRIYGTTLLYARSEIQARRNLEREIAALAAPPVSPG
jgi:predicted metal-dependent HD superfamily phosphohydrolase